MEESLWYSHSVRTLKSRADYENAYHELPSKIRQLLKHLDPRSKTSRNLEKDLAELAETEKKEVDRLLKFHQSFSLSHKYPKERHKNKYGSRAPARNHLISREDMKKFDKREGGF